MANLNGFDANNVQPNDGFDVLPAGEYDVCIVASEMAATKDGAGKRLKLEMQVLSGPYQNRKLWDGLNLVNQSTKAVLIAQGTLSAICRAVNVMTPQDSSDLHNKPMRVKIKVESSTEYGDQNKIVSYKARNAGPVANQSTANQQDSLDKVPW